MGYSREIIKKILQNIRFRVPNGERASYYTIIGNTLVRVSNHCTRLYVWDNILEKNPKWRGLPIVSIVFEDNGSTFDDECTILKRVRPRPIKVNEYVFSLNGDPQFLSKQDIDVIISDIKKISNGLFTDDTGKSQSFVRI